MDLFSWLFKTNHKYISNSTKKDGVDKSNVDSVSTSTEISDRNEEPKSPEITTEENIRNLQNIYDENFSEEFIVDDKYDYLKFIYDIILLQDGNLGGDITGIHSIYLNQRNIPIPQNTTFDHSTIQRFTDIFNYFYKYRHWGDWVSLDYFEDLKKRNLISSNELKILKSGGGFEELFEESRNSNLGFLLFLFSTNELYYRYVSLFLFKRKNGLRIGNHDLVSIEGREQFNVKPITIEDSFDFFRHSYNTIVLELKLIHHQRKYDLKSLTNILYDNKRLLKLLHEKDRTNVLENKFINYLRSLPEDETVKSISNYTGIKLIHNPEEIKEIRNKTIEIGKGVYYYRETIENLFQNNRISEEYYNKKIKEWDDGKRPKNYLRLKKKIELILYNPNEYPTTFLHDVLGDNYFKQVYNEKIKEKSLKIISDVLTKGESKENLNGYLKFEVFEFIKKEFTNSFLSYKYRHTSLDNILNSLDECYKLFNSLQKKISNTYFLSELLLLTGDEYLFKNNFKFYENNSSGLTSIPHTVIRMEKHYGLNIDLIHFVSKDVFEGISDEEFVETKNFLLNNKDYFLKDIKEFKSVLSKFDNENIDKFGGVKFFNSIHYRGDLDNIIDEKSESFKEITNLEISQREVLQEKLDTIIRKEIDLLTEESDIDYFTVRWKSEYHLYQEVRSLLKPYDVFRQYSPEFLGIQHYDIYVPELKIGVEYNGIQHYEPIKYFGGNESFVETVKRDKRKKLISEKNGVKLFIHKHDDQIEHTLNEIKRYIV